MKKKKIRQKRDKTKDFVKEQYAQIAREGTLCCPTCSPCDFDVVKQAMNIGYSERELKNIPEPALMGLGCGNPTALAELREGETVLDLGSGGGIDVFLAANRVGRAGHVIGIDMTDEMIKKAREIAGRYGYHNVEFRLGEIENLPVEDNSIDVLISNCVINLSPDKLKTFKEAFRVLKPGGRVLISDLVTEGELPDDIKRSFEAWAGCIAGALQREEYLSTIKKAGFKGITVVSEKSFSEPGMDSRLSGKIVSIQVRAYK